MRRMTVWLAKLVAAGLILSFLSIWTTGYIVNSYVETLLKQFNIPLQMQPMALSGVWGKLWGADSITADAELEQQPDSTANHAAAGGLSEPDSAAQSSSGPDDAAADASASPETDGAAQASPSGENAATGGNAGGQASPDPLTGIGGGSGSNANAAPPGDDGTEVAITSENMSEMKNQMSVEDKDRLFGLLMDKLPPEAWQSISAYVENGLTDSELTMVEQIMAQYLNDDEYKQMMEILKKY